MRVLRLRGYYDPEMTAFYHLSKDMDEAFGFIRSENISDGNVYGDCLMGEVYKNQPSKITPFFLHRTPLCHQSMFFSGSVFRDHGLYDLDYRITADYNCTVGAFRSDVPFHYLNIPVCIYLGGGVSESEKGVKLKKEEYKKIHRAYYSGWERFRYETLLFLFARKLRQWIMSDKSPRFLKKIYQKTVNRINK